MYILDFFYIVDYITHAHCFIYAKVSLGYKKEDIYIWQNI